MKNIIDANLEYLKAVQENMTNATEEWWSIVDSYVELSNKTTQDFTDKMTEITKSDIPMYTPKDFMNDTKEFYSHFFDLMKK